MSPRVCTRVAIFRHDSYRRSAGRRRMTLVAYSRCDVINLSRMLGGMFPNASSCRLVNPARKLPGRAQRTASAIARKQCVGGSNRNCRSGEPTRQLVLEYPIRPELAASSRYPSSGYSSATYMWLGCFIPLNRFELSRSLHLALAAASDDLRERISTSSSPFTTTISGSRDRNCSSGAGSSASNTPLMRRPRIASSSTRICVRL